MSSSDPNPSQAILRANDAINHSPFSSGGVAITIAHIVEGKAFISQVGDTEARVVRKNKAGDVETVFRTKGHGITAEDALEQGIVLRCRKLMTQVVGCNSVVSDIEEHVVPLNPDDQVMVYSDGLYENYWKDELDSLLTILQSTREPTKLLMDSSVERMKVLQEARLILKGTHEKGGTIHDGFETSVPALNGKTKREKTRVVELDRMPGWFIHREGNVYNAQGEKITRLKMDNISLLSEKYAPPAIMTDPKKKIMDRLYGWITGNRDHVEDLINAPEKATRDDIDFLFSQATQLLVSGGDIRRHVTALVLIGNLHSRKGIRDLARSHFEKLDPMLKLEAYAFSQIDLPIPVMMKRLNDLIKEKRKKLNTTALNLHVFWFSLKMTPEEFHQNILGHPSAIVRRVAVMFSLPRLNPADIGDLWGEQQSRIMEELSKKKGPVGWDALVTLSSFAAHGEKEALYRLQQIAEGSVHSQWQEEALSLLNNLSSFK